MANYLQPAKGRPSNSSGIGAAEHPGLASSKHYRIQLYKRGSKPLGIEGNLYENFAITVGSSWNDPLNFLDDVAGKVANAIPGVGNVVAKGVEASGFTKNIISSAKTWAGGSELTFDLPLRIDAIENTGSELIEPMRALMKTVLPTVLPLGVLSPPGPTAPSILKGGPLASTNISSDDWAKAMMTKFQDEAFHLRVGSFFHLFPAILENVTANLSTINEHETGHPMFIEFNLSIKSYLAATTQDMDNWIINNSKGRGSL